MKTKTVLNIDLKIENHIHIMTYDPAAAKPEGKAALREAYEILYNAGIKISYRTFCHHIHKLNSQEQMKEVRAQMAQEKNSESQSVSGCNHCSCHQILAEKGYLKFVEALKFFDKKYHHSGK